MQKRVLSPTRLPALRSYDFNRSDINCAANSIRLFEAPSRKKARDMTVARVKAGRIIATGNSIGLAPSLDFPACKQRLALFALQPVDDPTAIIISASCGLLTLTMPLYVCPTRVITR